MWKSQPLSAESYLVPFYNKRGLQRASARFWALYSTLCISCEILLFNYKSIQKMINTKISLQNKSICISTQFSFLNVFPLSLKCFEISVLLHALSLTNMRYILISKEAHMTSLSVYMYKISIVCVYSPWRIERRSTAGCGWCSPAAAVWWVELLWTALRNSSLSICPGREKQRLCKIL